jgi:hypothetical protein
VSYLLATDHLRVDEPWKRLWYTVEHDGTLEKFVKPHHMQQATLTSKAAFLFLVMGWRGGKTSWGPVWLTHGMEQMPGTDAIAIEPTYDLQRDVMLPKLLDWCQGTKFEGEYHKADRQYVTPYGTIFLLSATEPKHIQGRHVGRIWADEIGQYTYDAWFHIKSRVDEDGAQVLGTTTPYGQNWLFHECYKAYQRGDPDYDFFIGDSLENPSYSRAIWERNKRTMTNEEFSMFMKGQFMKASGLVYPDWDRDTMMIPFRGFRTPVIAAMDFGAADPTACLFAAWNERENRMEIYQDYYAVDLLAKEHAKVLGPLFIEYGVHYVAYDGHARQAKNELDDVLRKDYGLTLEWISCMEDIEKGVREMTKLMRSNQYFVNTTGCEHLVDETETYKRDKNGVPEARGPNHLKDCERYWNKVMLELKESGVIGGTELPPPPKYILKPGEEHIDHSWLKAPDFEVEEEPFIEDVM